MKNKITAFLAALSLCMGCRAEDGIPVLSPDEYESAVAKDTAAVILDVRTLSEYNEEHICGAVLLDVLDRDLFMAGVEKLDKSKTYYIYCRSGRRSHNAAVIMKDKGFKVADMKGGIIAWKAAGKPLCNSQQTYNKEALKFNNDPYKEKMKEPWLGDLIKRAISN